jgi:hypothetical protein
VDSGRNSVTSDAVVSGPQAMVSSLVITAREDVEIARQSREVLTQLSG